MTTQPDSQQHNPYGTSLPADEAQATKTQLMARSMLERREQGYTYGYFFKRNLPGYLKLLIAYGLPTLICVQLEQRALACVSVGMMIGSFLRDIDWYRAFLSTIPLSDAVTNWEKVQRIADGVETI